MSLAKIWGNEEVVSSDINRTHRRVAHVLLSLCAGTGAHSNLIRSCRGGDSSEDK